MITLHHAQGTCLSADIHEIDLKNWNQFKKYFSRLIDFDDKETVYVLTVDNREGSLPGRDQDLFISENIFRINEYLEIIRGKVITYQVVFLQEYKSYEDAYRVALNMRENSKLCYEN